MQGMSFLAMSTPPVLSNVAGNCDAYKPSCIGNAQKVLFFIALALIAIGISGHIKSLESFLVQQQQNQNNTSDQDGSNKVWQSVGVFALILLPIVGAIALPLIKPWSIRFGIPAICTVLATLLFISGSCSYKNCRQEGSPLTTVFRVFIRTIPMWMTFIMCGVVISIGNTYFLEQAKNMNHKLGKLKVPLQILLLFYELAKSQFTKLYEKVAKNVIPGKYTAPIGITVAMLFSILCCITAAKMETRRLDAIRRHGLHDISNGKIPMSMFWLLPQFLLLGALDGISKYSIDYFFNAQVPESRKCYSKLFSYGVIGAGTLGSVLSVFVVGKVSESGGKPSWFRDTLNKSRLDNYYWTLTVLSSINLVLHIMVASCYPYQDPPIEEVNKASENEESNIQD